MSDLTNRLLDEGLILSKRSFRDQCGGPDCALSANLAYEAANRIDALEECLRNIAYAKPSTWEPDVRDQFQEWAQNKARALLEGK